MRVSVDFPRPAAQPGAVSSCDAGLDGLGQQAWQTINIPSQLLALGQEVNGHSHRMFCSLHLVVYIYGSDHEQRS